MTDDKQWIADVFRVPPELIGLPRRPWPVRLWRWVTGFYRRG